MADCNVWLDEDDGSVQVACSECGYIIPQALLPEICPVCGADFMEDEYEKQ